MSKVRVLKETSGNGQKDIKERLSEVTYGLSMYSAKVTFLIEIMDNDVFDRNLDQVGLIGFREILKSFRDEIDSQCETLEDIELAISQPKCS